MTKKELRIAEIMTERNCDHDVAELLFQDDLMEKYPDLPEDDLDTREARYESEEN